MKLLKQKYNFLILAIFILTLVGCAKFPHWSDSYMSQASKQTLDEISMGKSRLVFLRPAQAGGKEVVSIYEIIDGVPQFIGLSLYNTKVVLDTDPGEHLFMVIAFGRVNFMVAYLDVERTYYSIVSVRHSALNPARNDSPIGYNINHRDFKIWDKSSPLVENTQTSLNWFEEHKQEIFVSYKKSWPLWEKKSLSEKKKKTLNYRDGVTIHLPSTLTGKSSGSSDKPARRLLKTSNRRSSN